MSSMWRLRIWQLATIARVLARRRRTALTSEAGASSGPTGDPHGRTIPADNTERDGPFWRKLEEEARAVATGVTDAQPRRGMLLIAECYKLLADRAELRKSHKDIIRGSRQHIGRVDHPNP